MKKLLEVLQSGAEYLAGKGVENPRLVMEQLMSHVLQCPRLQLYVRFETVIPEDKLVPLRLGIRRLGAGEPLQYVVGDAEFMGHRFRTDKRALIPRPDTETLVRSVLACDTLWAKGRPAVAEVGVGSGCVLISLALARPEVNYVGIDASEAALALAGENAAANRVSPLVVLKQGDLLAGFEPASLDAVVANLPYIPTCDCDALPVHIRDHEPRTALDGGVDGLDIIRRLARQAAEILKPGGWIFLEIGHDQAGRVVEILQACGFSGMVVHKDLGGRDRVVQAVR